MPRLLGTCFPGVGCITCFTMILAVIHVTSANTPANRQHIKQASLYVAGLSYFIRIYAYAFVSSSSCVAVLSVCAFKINDSARLVDILFQPSERLQQRYVSRVLLWWRLFRRKPSRFTRNSYRAAVHATSSYSASQFFRKNDAGLLYSWFCFLLLACNVYGFTNILQYAPP